MRLGSVAIGFLCLAVAGCDDEYARKSTLAAQGKFSSDAELFELNGKSFECHWDDKEVIKIWHEDRYLHLEPLAYRLFKNLERIDLAALFELRDLQKRALQPETGNLPELKKLQQEIQRLKKENDDLQRKNRFLKSQITT